MSNAPREERIPISADDSPSVVMEIIYQLKIKDVMETAVITAVKEDSMRHVQEIMRDNHLSCVPVVEEKNVVGIVSLHDIVVALDKGFINSPVDERMTREVISLQDDMPLTFAISYLNTYRFSRFPVLNKKQELVGILGSPDVIKSLLVEMNREVLRLEDLQKDEEGAVSPYAEMDFNVPRYNFEIAGHASTEIKKALKLRNIDPKIIRRVAIASYELEINLVVHSNGGIIHCHLQPDKVIIMTTDAGPGIPDVDQALQEGWSTASEYVRSLGFGAGMGLANIKRVSDEFFINSTVGVGTLVRSVIDFDSTKEEE